MTDREHRLAEIKALATAAQAATEAAFRRNPRQYDDAGNAAFVAFQRVANPETVLGLIAEVERLRELEAADKKRRRLLDVPPLPTARTPYD